jgi:hypothetical protein
MIHDPAETYVTSKQFVKALLLSCPSSLYASHVSPLLSPWFEHIPYCLQLTWAPILNVATKKKHNGVDSATEYFNMNSGCITGQKKRWELVCYILCSGRDVCQPEEAACISTYFDSFFN